MIRRGRWKYWRHYDSGRLAPALFDLDSDPDELVDLGAAPEHAQLRSKLDARLLDGWDPVRVGEIAAEDEIGFRRVSEWGREVQPPSPYLVPLPPPQFEAQAERR